MDEKNSEYLENSILKESNAADALETEDKTGNCETVKSESGENKHKKHSGSKVKAIVITLTVVILFAFAAAAIAAYLAYDQYVLVGDGFGSHKIYARNVTEADLSGSDIEDFSSLARLDKLETIDLTNTSIDDLSVLYDCKSLKSVTLLGKDISAEKCIEFYEALPDTRLKCNVVIGTHTYDSQIEELKPDGFMDDEISMLAALRWLKSLDLTDFDVSNENYDYLHERLTDCLIDRNVTILDVTVKSTVTALDFSGYEHSFDEFKAAFDENLKYLPNLQKVDMCYCGLSDEEMAELNDTYSGVKFIWLLKIADGSWHIRTDAKVFSTLNQNDGINEYDQKTYAPIFKYCTDLIALDLGHNKITSLEGIQNLKKLRALILTDNRITDISPLAELTELEFLEINATNRLTSLEPLRNLNKLKILNIYSSDGISDYSPLYNKPNLIYVLFPKSIMNSSNLANQIKEFSKSNPNCKYDYITGYYSPRGLFITTTAAYRSLKYRVGLKRGFAKWWAVRDDDVGKNWEKLKLDSSFSNANGEYYYNSRKG
ncbi:MAG: leucine-rich repeat domain-containing protein [Firmicutes bacterium]|nr:leucine-rich repeat domain-containing protein [Bacillota bacterium]